MKAHGKICVALAFSLGIFNFAIAESSTSSAGKPLGILEAWELALSSDTQWQSEGARLAAQREVVPQARAALLPTVSTRASFTQKDQEYTEDSVVVESGVYDGSSQSYSLEVRQPLFNRSASKYYASAKQTTRVVDYNLSLARQSLALRLSEAYFGLLLANESAKLAESELKAIARQLDQTQQRFKVGLVSKTDVLEAQAAYDQTRVTVALAENQQAIQQQNLGIIVGKPVDQLFMLKPTITLLDMPVTVDEWVEQVLENSSALKIAQIDQGIAGLTRDATQSSYWPTIDAVASYSHLDEDGKSEVVQYGVEATWTPFQGGGLRSRVREANLKYQSASTDAAGLRQTLSRDARNIYKSLATDIVSIRAQTQATLSSESALEATRAGYQVGTRNVVDVLNAQRTVFAAKRDLEESRHRWILDRLQAAYLDSSLSEAQLKEIDGWLAKD